MTKIVISEPKTKKSYQIEKDIPSLVGMKIGDKFDGSTVGLNGFSLEVTGGSDKEGFPMRKDLDGSARIKALLTKGVGFRGGKMKKVKGKMKFFKVSGMRKRKYIRGNTVSEDIMQVNCKIVEGEGDVAMILGIPPKEKPAETKE
ncbi:MAG: 30S ribosomal protein S6e [Nanoarchaeota archaeon]|nr:30S ribosomal protein S6e [Nanoarchaeota archaeon]